MTRLDRRLRRYDRLLLAIRAEQDANERIANRTPDPWARSAIYAANHALETLAQRVIERRRRWSKTNLWDEMASRADTLLDEVRHGDRDQDTLRMRGAL